MTTDKETALNKAKLHIAIRTKSAFISTILFSLKFSWDETIPTACTDGIVLIVNPKFFLSLTLQEQVFLLEHESYHVAFMHMGRVEKRDFRLWNMATDYVINLMLVEANGVMPEGGLLDRKYQNFTSEEVYQDLVRNPPPESEDFILDMEESTKESQQDIEEAVGEIVIMIDSSGSVSDKEFNQWFAEVYAIAATIQPSKLTICDFDTEIHSVNNITCLEDMMDINFTGRGGTEIEDVIAYGNKHMPTVMMIFTDGYFSQENIDPKCPIIWAIHGNKSFKSNWGRVIEYPM